MSDSTWNSPDDHSSLEAEGFLIQDPQAVEYTLAGGTSEIDESADGGDEAQSQPRRLGFTFRRRKKGMADQTAAVTDPDVIANSVSDEGFDQIDDSVSSEDNVKSRRPWLTRQTRIGIAAVLSFLILVGVLVADKAGLLRKGDATALAGKDGKAKDADDKPQTPSRPSPITRINTDPGPRAESTPPENPKAADPPKESPSVVESTPPKPDTPETKTAEIAKPESNEGVANAEKEPAPLDPKETIAALDDQTVSLPDTEAGDAGESLPSQSDKDAMKLANAETEVTPPPKPADAPKATEEVATASPAPMPAVDLAAAKPESNEQPALGAPTPVTPPSDPAPANVAPVPAPMVAESPSKPAEALAGGPAETEKPAPSSVIQAKVTDPPVEPPAQAPVESPTPVVTPEPMPPATAPVAPAPKPASPEHPAVPEKQPEPPAQPETTPTTTETPPQPAQSPVQAPGPDPASVAPVVPATEPTPAPVTQPTPPAEPTPAPVTQPAPPAEPNAVTPSAAVPGPESTPAPTAVPPPTPPPATAPATTVLDPAGAALKPVDTPTPTFNPTESAGDPPPPPAPVKAPEPKANPDVIKIPTIGRNRMIDLDDRRSPEPRVAKEDPTFVDVTPSRSSPVKGATGAPAGTLTTGDGESEPAPSMATPHTVQRGENLWTISRLYYGYGWYYKALWAANKETVAAVDKLYVGQIIRIPPPEDLDRAYVESARKEFEADRKARSLASTDRTPRGAAARTTPVNVSLRKASQSTDLDASGSRVEAGELKVSLPTVDPLDRNQDGDMNTADDDTVAVASDEEFSEPVRKRGPRYKIRPYETLRSIARDTLGDSRRSTEIYELNQTVIDDPNHLIVGQIIELPAEAKTNRTSRRPLSSRGR